MQFVIETADCALPVNVSLRNIRQGRFAGKVVTQPTAILPETYGLSTESQWALHHRFLYNTYMEPLA